MAHNRQLNPEAVPVTESYKIRISQQIKEFREGHDTSACPAPIAPDARAVCDMCVRLCAELVFPSTLNNIERKYIHSLCSQLGLSSKSHGSVPRASAPPACLLPGRARSRHLLPAAASPRTAASPSAVARCGR